MGVVFRCVLRSLHRTGSYSRFIPPTGTKKIYGCFNQLILVTVASLEEEETIGIHILWKRIIINKNWLLEESGKEVSGNNCLDFYFDAFLFIKDIRVRAFAREVELGIRVGVV